jgi:hypothetical protein
MRVRDGTPISGLSQPASGPDAETSRARALRNIRLGRVSLAWLIVSAALVIFGLVVISSEHVTNRILLFAVALAGAAGAASSAAIELVTYLGLRRFKGSWTAYYFIRPLLGAVLAVLVYAAIRGGLFSSNAPPAFLNLYGLVAFSFLVGAFAKATFNKLLDVFDLLLTQGSAYSATRQDDKAGLTSSELDPYHGFLRYEIAKGETDAWLLTVWLQREISPAEARGRCKEISVGNGVQVVRTKFRLTVFRHNYCAVSPESLNIAVEPRTSATERHTFRFEDGASDRDQTKPASRSVGLQSPRLLTALIEISQHGETVGVLDLGGAHEGDTDR